MTGALGFAALLGLGLALVVLVGAVLTAHRLRNPPRRTAAWAASRGSASDPGELDTPIAFTEKQMTLGASAVLAWEIEGETSEGPVIIATPGWGDSKLGILARLEALRGWASLIIAWDPPGSGESPGRCGMGVTEPALIRELCERYGGAREIILYGWSLGGGASVAAGDGPGVVGVIAEAPYRVAPTPARNVLRGAGLPYRVNLPLALWGIGVRLGVGPGWRGFDRAEHAARCASRVLVIHGTDDGVCPIADGREIAQAATDGAIVEIESGGHNDLWSDVSNRAACLEAVRAFGECFTGSPVSSRG